jgi:CBS domain containing-hemolysin-like protein
MKPTGYWVSGGIVIFAAASFFFALAETSLFALGKWRARQLAEILPAKGAGVLRLLEKPAELLATIALGNTMANAGIVVLGLWPVWVEQWKFWPTLALILSLILIVGEILPKTLAVRAPERWAVRVAPVMLLIESVSGWFQNAVEEFNDWLLEVVLTKTYRPQTGISDEEYQELLEMAYQQGTLAQSEKEIILQIISLDQKTAKDVMKPRSQMKVISDELSVEDMLAAARKHKHRRLPIFDEIPDEEVGQEEEAPETIVGVLNARKLLLEPEINLEEVIEPPSFVPESMNVLQLLQSLQRQQRGLAIVLDEFGDTAGLVTIEDILEEVVGEIRGEEEAAAFVMEKLDEARWRVSGTMGVDDFRREYPALGEVPDVDTMGGLLVALSEVVPTAGHSVLFRGLRLTAQVVDERRVRELLVEVVKKKK